MFSVSLFVLVLSKVTLRIQSLSTLLREINYRFILYLNKLGPERGGATSKCEEILENGENWKKEWRCLPSCKSWKV